jgi:6-phosphogluconolactonase
MASGVKQDIVTKRRRVQKRRTMTPREVRIYHDLPAVSDALARDAAALLENAATTQSVVTLALSGGETPRGLYELLARDYRQQVPWQRLQLFWSDERYVPHGDPQSNVRMVRENLLRGARLPAANAHPMPTELADPEDAARAYERALHRFFTGPFPRFDLVLLGMGADGHTASLFPSSPALEEAVRWVVPTTAPSEPKQRLSLTLPVLNHSAAVYFLVAGTSKAETVARVFRNDTASLSLPASRVEPFDGRLVWWLDEAAARGVQPTGNA